MRRILILLLAFSLMAAPARSGPLCADVGPAGDRLCAVNTEKGPQWFLITGCEDMLTVEAPATEEQVVIVGSSASGGYLHILSAGRGGESLGVFAAGNIDHGGAPERLASFESGAFDIEAIRWEGELLEFRSDRPVRDPEGRDDGRPAAPLRYRYDPITRILSRP